MLKFIKNNKKAIALIAMHLACILINIDNIRAAFAWFIATGWVIGFIRLESESRFLIDKYRRYVRNLQQENEHLKLTQHPGINTKA